MGIKRRAHCLKRLETAPPPANWPMKDSSWTSIASPQNCWATKTAGRLAGREIAKASATSLRQCTPSPARTEKCKKASSWTHGFKTTEYTEHGTCNRCVQIIYATMVGTGDLALIFWMFFPHHSVRMLPNNESAALLRSDTVTCFQLISSESFCPQEFAR